MNYTALLLLLLVSPVSLAHHPADLPEAKYIGPYYVASTSRDASLDLNHAVFELEFPRFDNKGRKTVTVEYSCNGVIHSFVMDSTFRTSVTVSPGKYKFQLITDAGHDEIITDSIEIKPGFRSTVVFHFIDMTQELVLKPVIYLYPEHDQEVNVLLEPKGDFIFTYPAYENGWNGIAHPDGSMTVNGKNYPYLFWEGEQQLGQLADYSTGFVVEKANVTTFLEEKLTAMGLNTKEQTDFITFWGPRMSAAEKGFAQFIFNTDYDRIATLNITPAPNAIFRVYLLWTPLDGATELHPQAQQMESVDRSRFYVIEWGGSELNVQCILTNHD